MSLFGIAVVFERKKVHAGSIRLRDSVGEGKEWLAGMHSQQSSTMNCEALGINHRLTIWDRPRIKGQSILR